MVYFSSTGERADFSINDAGTAGYPSRSKNELLLQSYTKPNSSCVKSCGKQNYKNFSLHINIL